jgi:hypothetical protein
MMGRWASIDIERMTADEVVFRDATLIVGRERWGKALLKIRIRRFLGLPDPDPLVRGMDTDPFLFL